MPRAPYKTLKVSLGEEHQTLRAALMEYIEGMEDDSISAARLLDRLNNGPWRGLPQKPKKRR